MEFRVLGPLEVADQGQPIDLGARKPRALLGRLLIDVNHVVAADRLIEDLWEGRHLGRRSRPFRPTCPNSARSA